MKRLALIALLGSAMLAGCTKSNQSQAATDVIALEHIAVADAHAALQGRTAGAAIVPDDRTNSLIVHGSPEQVQTVREEVAKLDQAK